MSFLDRFKSMSLAKLLVELTALVGLMILGFFASSIAIDQYRHWTDPQHVATQKIKRDFLCFPQRGFAPQESDKLLALQFEVEALLDAARQEMAPTDFLGKLRQLGLCAEFNTINAGGLQFAVPSKSAQERQRLSAFSRGDDNPVQRRLAEIETLATVFPDFPPAIQDRTGEVLREMLVLVEDLNLVAEPSLIELGPGGPAEDTDTAQTRDDLWVMIVGGDQTAEAAFHQVERTDEILTAAGVAAKAEIYRIRSWWRTVVPFPTKAAADAALSDLGNVLPYGGYVRQVDDWCDALGETTLQKGVAVTPCG